MLSINGRTSAITGGGGPFDSTPYFLLMTDGFIVGTGQTMTLTLSGLTALQPYDLYLYSAGIGTGENRTTTFTIAGNSRSASDAGSPSAFAEGVNYVHFSSQTADASGQISIGIQGTGGSPVSGQSTFGGIVNGFQITPVPEPATICLIAVAVCCIALVKRSQSRFKYRAAGGGAVACGGAICWMIWGLDSPIAAIPKPQSFSWNANKPPFC